MTSSFLLAVFIRVRFDFRRDHCKFREGTGIRRCGERERTTCAFGWTVDRRRLGGQRSAILILCGQIAVARAFLAKPSLTVNALQCAATEGGVPKQSGGGKK